MTVTLVTNIARPISSALSSAFSMDAVGKLDAYGKIGTAWSPLSLFASSEVGAWYDPSDLSTMFQDRAGTTPVTADGQPVGLILDKSNGLVLGPELVTNGDFSGGLTGWTVAQDKSGDVSIASGKVRTISDGIADSSIHNAVGQNVPTVVGRTYKVSFDVTLVTPGYYNYKVQLGPVDILPWAQPGSSGTKTCFFTATSTTSFVNIYGISFNSTGEVLLDNISVKELPGNHASQATAASRPLKTSTGAADWTNYDAVDDVLNTKFPSSLGSSCTVCRANVGAAPTILTAQTIGTSYADSTDNAGLIIINRALTAQETTDVTAWLTAKGATA